MSEQAPAVPKAAQAAPVIVAPAKPKNAIQVIEEEIQNFLKQREQAIANSHAIEGALQAAHFLLGKLKAEAAKAIAAVEGDVKSAVGDVESEAEKLFGAVTGKK